MKEYTLKEEEDITQGWKPSKATWNIREITGNELTKFKDMNDIKYLYYL